MTSVNIDEMMKVILRLKKKILIVMKQRDAAIEEARIACESRDAVIEEARIDCESRDAAIEETRIANESRDAVIEEARIDCESRDAAIEEVRIANEYRDAIEKANIVINNSLIDLETLLPEDVEEEVAFDYGVIKEVRIANESRDAAIEEVRIANESRDAAISHLDKWKNKYERKEYLERLLPKDEDESDGKKSDDERNTKNADEENGTALNKPTRELTNEERELLLARIQDYIIQERLRLQRDKAEDEEEVDSFFTQQKKLRAKRKIMELTKIKEIIRIYFTII